MNEASNLDKLDGDILISDVLRRWCGPIGFSSVFVAAAVLLGPKWAPHALIARMTWPFGLGIVICGGLVWLLVPVARWTENRLVKRRLDSEFGETDE